MAQAADDNPTLAALGVLAFALTDVTHEALGHGVATLAVGGQAVLLTTCNFVSNGHYSRWIPAAGGLMNVAVGLGALAALRLGSRLSPLWRYFLVLLAAFNLFFACGYPAYSGVARFGDWAAVIAGHEPQWLWRGLLMVVAVGGYYASMRLLTWPLAAFAGGAGGQLDKARLRQLTITPYVAAMVLACMAGVRNPHGWRFMLAAGLPAAAAAFGLTQVVHFIEPVWKGEAQEVVGPMRRSWLWIAAAVVVLIFFVGVLGPGIRFAEG